MTTATSFRTAAILYVVKSQTKAGNQTVKELRGIVSGHEGHARLPDCVGNGILSHSDRRAEHDQFQPRSSA